MVDYETDDPLMSADGVRRCFGTRPSQDILARYHDEEWGVPVHDDRHLFEMLTLEGAQAGLSWDVVLRKRARYRAAFHDFDIARVATMDDDALEALRQNEGIVRNRLKIYSTRSNAAAVLAVQKSHGSFAAYLWAFVDGQPVINQTASLSQVPASTSLSDDLSKDMKRRGFKFVGSTIIYAFMQGIGMVDDHVAGCWRRADSTA
ncbi:MAG: DNA-3-methyladenine glycosylase I [Alphaproteobacteria bacterium]|nr:DNA-3-methyladenine glycosylase I [Alphaproteobacteria bacterium]